MLVVIQLNETLLIPHPRQSLSFCAISASTSPPEDMISGTRGESSASRGGASMSTARSGRFRYDRAP